MISVRTWLVVDAVLDNVAAVAVQSGEDDAVVRRVNALRERGWDASAAHPLRGRGPVGWPPLDATLDVEMDGTDLPFLRDQVDAAVVVAAGLVALDDLAALRDAKTELTRLTLSPARRAKESAATLTGRSEEGPSVQPGPSPHVSRP